MLFLSSNKNYMWKNYFEDVESTLWMAQSWEDESKMPLGQILDFQNLHYCKPAKEAHFQVLIFNKCITELHKVQCFEHSGLKKRQEGTKSKERGGRNANSKKSFLSLSSFALISSGSVRSLGGSSFDCNDDDKGSEIKATMMMTTIRQWWWWNYFAALQYL